jgi:DNA polymerase-3 subunit alpha
MAAEKESFGFYFSGHPVDAHAHVAAAQGARTFAQLGALPAPAEGGRTAATMAALIEDTRWRTSAKGRRYMMATLSDPSGQFEATVFDDQVAEQVQGAARAGTCVLLNVELDRRPGEETPRVTVRALQPLEGLARRVRLQLEVEIADPAALPPLAEAMAAARGGNGRLVLAADLGDGRADLVLGRDFAIDAELAARIERIEGIRAARLEPLEPPRLALVG